nr:uncharacterized protein LOC123763067 isoform X2 [Procambarus clarkii]
MPRSDKQCRSTHARECCEGGRGDGATLRPTTSHSPAGTSSRCTPLQLCILITTTMPLTSLMTVILVAELAGLGYARTVHVNYSPVPVAAAAGAADVGPGGLASPLYDKDASLGSAPEETAVSATSSPPSSHSERLQHNALDDPFNYDYSYGDPHYDYNTNESRPTEEKDNPLLTPSTPELVHVTARPTEGRGNPLPTSGTPQLDGDDDTVYTTTPESDNPDDDVADDTGFFSAFHWLQSQWKKAEVNIQQMEQQLQEMKKSVTEFIHMFGDLVEEGAEYFIHKLRQTATKVNVREWSLRHQQQDETGGAEDEAQEEEEEDVTGKSSEAGMVPEHMVSQYQRGGGGLEHKIPEDAHPQRTVGDMPNLFQDSSVMQKIDQLVKAGILTREDIQAVLGAV